MRNLSKLALSAAISFLAFNGIAQEQAKPKFELKPYGYAAFEIIYDTYKSYDTRDGELYFYPSIPQFDKNGKDINSKSMIEMLSLSSRLGLKISGPDFYGAKSTAMIETDFYGTSQANVRTLRLRHAMINLKWEKAELLMGNYWHPLIVPEMIPGVVSFGGGAPFHALNRSPQIRYTYNFSPTIRFIGAALVYGYHRSKGPYDAQRYSGKPDVHLQLSVGNRKEFLAGFTAGYKWLTPRLITDSLYKTSETVGSYDLHAFIMVKPATTSIKVEAVYGQNLSFLNMIGGYGMKTGSNNAEGDYSYTNLNTISVWGDIQQDIDSWTIGVFAGYQKLLGADDNYTTIKDYNLNDDLSRIIRVSPRLVYRAEALSIALEYILTTAVYGKTWDAKHNVTETMDPVSNNRFLLRVTYNF